MNKHELVLNHMTLAQKIANQRKSKIKFINLDEIESAAFMGLVEAANTYDESRSENFIHFAIFRIYGSIRDYLRELSWGSRKNPLKREFQNLEDMKQIEKTTKDNEMFEKILSDLPERNKTALRKYYIDCDKLSEIASELNVNESRVSQIISESKSLLKDKWLHLENELYETAA